MVFLSPLTVHAAKRFLVLSYPITQQSSLFSIFRLFSYISLSRQVHPTKSVELCLTFHRRIFIRHTLHPLHQSVMMLSRLVFFRIYFAKFSLSITFVIIIKTNQLFLLQPSQWFIHLLWGLLDKMLVVFDLYPNNTQINAFISINTLLHKTWFSQ